MRRATGGCVAIVLLTTGCFSSGRYLYGRGGPEYDVTIVNNCSRFTARLYLDDEYRNRQKIDVKPRPVGSKPRSMRLPAGRHTYHVEFNEFDAIKIHEGSFVVRGPSRFEMC